MRHRTDDNQNEVVEALLAVGASVKIVSMVDNFLDLVVGFRGVNYLMEVKDGNKPPSQQKLTPGEQKFQDGWEGKIDNVNSVYKALIAIGAIRPPYTD